MTYKDMFLAIAIVVLLFTWAVVGYSLWIRGDYNTRRIAELEAEARPLIIVDKYSEVYLNGEKIDKEVSAGEE